MRFAYYSVEGESLAWQRRLLDEGHDVLVYIDKAKLGRFAQHVGDGLVPKATTFADWNKFSAQPGTITFFDFSGVGDLADTLRRAGRLVIGAGHFCDKLEDDRPFGEAFAEQHGIDAPPSYRFSTITQAMAFLKRDPKQKIGDGGWAWKPNRVLGSDATWVDSSTEGMIGWLKYCALPEYGDSNTCLLQERIPGVALMTARWWNGRAWAGPYKATLEEKKLMAGDVGPSTGASLDIEWLYPNSSPRIAQALNWDGLANTFRKKNAPPGLYDINAIVNRQGAYFLEWTPRLGYDSEFVSQRAITDLGGFLTALVTGGDVDRFFDANQIYVGVRVTVPPYPFDFEHVKEHKRATLARGTPFLKGPDGLWDKHFVATGVAAGGPGLVVQSEAGYAGVVVASGSSLTGCCDEIYAYLKDELCIPNMQYRPDAEKILQDDLDELTELGWETTPVLTNDEEAA